MYRNIENELRNWKNDPDRKVLLLRGARQVGKTYSVRVLGGTFRHYLEVNFEEEPSVKTFFRDSLNPIRISEKLSAFYSTPLIPGESLLFLDEVQSCPEALSSLRFFQEKMPGLHVAAAGSLLDFALSQIPSLGVGRIETLFMFPLTLEEYLCAVGEKPLLDVIQKADCEHPVDGPFHRRLVEHVRTYQLIGGMPAAVGSYAAHHDLLSCFKILDDLVLTIQDDFAKYRGKVPMARLAEVFRSIVLQSGGKFKYSRAGTESSRALKDSLQLLVQAGLAYRIVHTDARGIPLGAQEDERRFKAILFDIGIHQRLLGLDVPDHLTASDIDLVNKGSMSEVFVGLELVGNRKPRGRPSLHYWHREARGSNAEVDYLVQEGTEIVPVEVKAGIRGQMQSMHLFMKERGLGKGLRVSLENFGAFGPVLTVPMYAVGMLARGGLRRSLLDARL